MMEELGFFEIARAILLGLSPFIFMAGVLLLLSKESYNNIESKLNRDIGGFKKKVLPKLESNIYTLHNWVLGRNIFFGVFFIAYFILLYIFLLRR